MPRSVRRQDLVALHQAIVDAAKAEHRLHSLLDAQKIEATRWRERADWASARAEIQLALEAHQRAEQHSLRATRLQELYQEAGSRVRALKRHLREAESGRESPDLAVLLADPLEARFETLQREERLEQELADLKARLGESASEAQSSEAQTREDTGGVDRGTS